VGNPCRVCASSDLSRAFTEMVARGMSDQKIADALGLSRAGAQRHRTAHVVAVARAVVEAGAKDAPARAQRQEIIAAAEAGTLKPEDYLSLSTIVGELRSIGSRLERTASAAEMGGQHPVVVSAAAQQLRLNETKSRLGGHGGFAPQRNQGGGEVPVFSLTINLGGGRTERIDMSAADHTPALPIIDIQPARPGDATTVVEFPELLPESAG